MFGSDPLTLPLLSVLQIKSNRCIYFISIALMSTLQKNFIWNLFKCYCFVLQFQVHYDFYVKFVLFIGREIIIKKKLLSTFNSSYFIEFVIFGLFGVFCFLGGQSIWKLETLEFSFVIKDLALFQNCKLEKLHKFELPIIYAC